VRSGLLIVCCHGTTLSAGSGLGRAACLADTPGPVAAVTHGGVTVDLLRNLLGDDAVPAAVLAAGIPPCAVTAVDDMTVVMIASASHLPSG
jgi:hypothetical protein